LDVNLRQLNFNNPTSSSRKSQ